MRTTLALLAAPLLMLSLSGCAHHAAEMANRTAETGAIVEGVVPISDGPTLVEGPYLLDTGDKLRIFVYGQPNLSRGYTVEHDGTISVPLIGRIGARGRTPRQLEGAIKAALAKDIIRDPEVNVDILQNRPFFILGEVKTAGQYPYVTGMTVETAVALAGGYSERASDETFKVTRRVNGTMHTVEVNADFGIWPGDTVTVRERFF